MKKMLETFIAAMNRRNMLTRGVALLLAVIVWALVSKSQLGRNTFIIPVEVRNPFPDTVVADYFPRNVKVSFEGKKETLRSINVKNIKAFVDVPRNRIGTPQRSRIQVTRQYLPEGITFSLSTGKATVVLEKRGERLIRVVPVLAGEPREGFIVTAVRVVPEYVTVSGSRTRVDTLETLRTEEIALHGEAGDVMRDVALIREQPGEITTLPTVVKVLVRITEYRAQNEFELPLALRNRHDGYAYAPAVTRVTAVVRGGPEGAEFLRNVFVKNTLDAFLDMGGTVENTLHAIEKRKYADVEVPVTVLCKDAGAPVTLHAFRPGRVMVRVKSLR